MNIYVSMSGLQILSEGYGERAILQVSWNCPDLAYSYAKSAATYAILYFAQMGDY